MGMLNKLFGKSGNKPKITKVSNSRYTFEILNTAYSNMWYHREIAMLTIPVNNPNSDEVEVYFHTPKETADMLIKDFFMMFSQADAIVQDGDNNNFDIAYFNIYDDKVEIGYIGNKVNTDFEVKLLRENGRWYCTEIGTQKFTQPICIGHKK